MNDYMFVLAQIAVGLVVIVAVFFLSLYVMKQDSLMASQEKGVRDSSHDTLIIDGYTESARVARMRFGTVNPYSASFIPIPRAYNRMGGAQFTYSFWIFVGDSHRSTVAGKHILLKGDNDKYKYQKWNKADTRLLDTVEDVAIKCPLIRFGDTFKDIVLEFNTQDDINHQINLSSVEHATDTTIRHNLLDLIQQAWVYMTFTFEDNVPINDFENGIVVRFYINDILYHTHRVASTLRQNNGDMYLFPTGEISDCRIADLKYSNYAVGFKEVKQHYGAGPPKLRATLNDDRKGIGMPLHLSEYNKIDLYNR
jgi:hypothetical protein